MAKKKGPAPDKMGTKKPRKIGQVKGVGNPGTTTYTGKPGVNRGSKKGY
jgi:hypothetical protein